MMTIIGITGGIGSGKSLVCRMLEEHGYAVFYCDDEAKRIIRSDAQVREALSRLIEGVYNADGTLQKNVLAAYLCRGTDHAARVDAIVHPAVRRAFIAWAERQTAPRVFMECALLFESGFDQLCHQTALVYAPADVRIERVMQRDGVSREQALRWMALQMPEEEKRRRAHHIIYNAREGKMPDIAPLLNN